MIDLHTHTFFSDGELGLAELVRRAQVAGYDTIGVADHADGSNLEFLVPRLRAGARELSAAMTIRVLAGVELTHVPPVLVAPLVARARALGADFVAVHGETITEPVMTGTNRAAIEAGADYVAHPGLISREDAAAAAARGVALEVTTRRGHAYANGHVVQVARATGARLIINNDAHAPGDLVGKAAAARIAAGAGLSAEEFQQCIDTAYALVERVLAAARHVA
jgi:histidinol phosphatase-like PHP family hydrolase